MMNKIKEALRSHKEVYQENYDEVAMHTAMLQRHFSACICILFVVYTAAMLLTDYLIWGVWRSVLLMGFLVAAVAAVNWTLFRKRVFSEGKTILAAGNVFVFVLLELLVLTRNVSDGYISNTLIVCALLSTAIISFQPKQYAAMISAATISEMAMCYVDYISFGLPLATLVNFWIDAWIILITAVIINLIIVSLRYSLLEEQHQLRRESVIDSLTGLYTRKYFERFFQLHHREDELSAMFHMDLDNFKTLNDTMGHGQGDEMLMRVADILRQQFQKTDCVARVGGDEFMVFMASIVDRRTVVEKVEHILSCFPIVIEEGGREVPISISIGAVFSEKGKSLKYQELYEMADAAMYQAKHGGKGRAVLLRSDGSIEDCPVYNR